MTTIIALLSGLAGVVGTILTRYYLVVSQRQDAVLQAQEGLRSALATGRIDDAAFWGRRLKDLEALPKGMEK